MEPLDRTEEYWLALRHGRGRPGGNARGNSLPSAFVVYVLDGCGFITSSEKRGTETEGADAVKPLLTRQTESVESTSYAVGSAVSTMFSSESEVRHEEVAATNGRGKHAVNVLFLRVEQQMNASPTNYTIARRTGFAVPSTTARSDKPRHNLNARSWFIPGAGVFSWTHSSPAPHRGLREWSPVRLPVRFRPAVTRGGVFL